MVNRGWVRDQAKNPKSSHWGSIAGAPSEVTVEGDAGMSWGGTNDVAMVRSWNARLVNGWGQKIEIEPLGLNFGRAVGSGSGG